MVNNPLHSDVSFVVQDKVFYAHKIIVSMLSEKYKAMFTGGLKESQGNQTIIVNHISYEVFEQIMQYLYTGDFKLDEKNISMDQIVDILRVADQEFLDDVSIKFVDFTADQNALRAKVDQTMQDRKFHRNLSSGRPLQRRKTQGVLCLVPEDQS